MGIRISTIVKKMIIAIGIVSFFKENIAVFPNQPRALCVHIGPLKMPAYVHIDTQMEHEWCLSNYTKTKENNSIKNDNISEALRIQLIDSANLILHLHTDGTFCTSIVANDQEPNRNRNRIRCMM